MCGKRTTKPNERSEKMLYMTLMFLQLRRSSADAKRLKNPKAPKCAFLDLGAWGIFPNKQIIGLRAQ